MMLLKPGMTWLPVTYDPDLNLMYLTTGNPHPVMANRNRAGTNLFTGCIIALSPDTGKMAWSFQPMPHDTHDWDATETAVLVDAQVAGRPRKLLAQASRNGVFFVLDRVTGKALSSTEFVKTNWMLGFDDQGQPISNPAKMPQESGALVSPDSVGAANWPAPSASPNTGLFYVNASRSFSMAHSAVAAATMYPSTPTCNTSLRTLDPDDVAGIRSLYPPIQTPPPAPTGFRIVK